MPDESLLKKLHIKPGMRLLILNAPESYLDRLGAAANGQPIDTSPSGQYDVIQAFVHNRAEVDQLTPVVLLALKTGGLLWMTYPKGTGKIKTDIHRDTGWDALNQAGFEGIALIAVDETWSAMRFRPTADIKRQSH